MQVNFTILAALFALSGCGLTPYTTAKVDSGQLDNIDSTSDPESDGDVGPGDDDPGAGAGGDGSPDGDFGPSDPCGDGLYDCAMVCHDTADYDSALGDGRCDDGPGIDLDCDEYSFDNGDCASAGSDGTGSGGSESTDACPEAGEIEDCNGECHPSLFVGDGYCDDGAYGADFSCDAFGADGGDCSGSDGGPGGDSGAGSDGESGSSDGGSSGGGDAGTDCGFGEVEDCTGACASETWLGDGWCDDGGWFGSDFDCAEFDYDEGDCGVDAGDGSGGDSDDGSSDDGGSDCFTGEVEDCTGACASESWVGDGFCDDGSYGAYFDCAEFDYDEGDCGSDDGSSDDGGSDCFTGEVEDCTGACASESWVGDGFCDDGTYGVYFDCAEFDYDEGDCDSSDGDGSGGDSDDGSSDDGGSDCFTGEIEDCTGACASEDWLGDGFCDDGTYGVYFDCAEFDYDEGDCDSDDGSSDEGSSDCFIGEVEDCTGACAPESWVGDGFCDDGSYGAYFDCAEFDYDEGDCDSGDGDGSGGDSDDGSSDDGGSDCFPGEVEDCTGACASESWVGDGFCDDGSYGAYFDCAEFDYDEGDCDSDDGSSGEGSSDCFIGEIEDCTGVCAPESWVGDGFCDDGSYGAYFDCAEFDYDEGDCDSGDGDGSGGGSDDGGSTGGADGADECTDAGDVPDCNGDCYPAAWVGDGYCEDGSSSWGGDFYCAEFSYDGGDCSDSSSGSTGDAICGFGEVLDCVGVCVTELWIGDGYCDDGTWGADLDCAAFSYDEGDCSGSGSSGSDATDSWACSTAGDIEDCNGDCYPASWVGDGYCEDGSTSWGGDFYCAEFSYDGGDCFDSGSDSDPGCSAGEVVDCLGECAPESWVGDGFCDDGSYGAYFDCAEFSYDLGDCF